MAQDNGYGAPAAQNGGNISHRLRAPVVVGRDIMELLSNSMYVDPLMVYREYVQNAVDSIDEAVDAGVLSDHVDGRVDIDFDLSERRVVIRDNGMGLANTEFAQTLMSFGASKKRGTDARGFRGIGRLSGLGYVQELVFRSRAKGDGDVFEAVWDGRVVRDRMSGDLPNGDFSAVVQQASRVERIDAKEYPAHFFEVELRRPRRIGNDTLLNEERVQGYISQVCPCPFSQEFFYGEEIVRLLAPHGRAGRSYRIYVNGGEEPVYRPYGNVVTYSGTRCAPVDELETFQIEKLDGGLAAIGWVAHHAYQGSIPARYGVRGLVGRVGNIQIGDYRLFSDVFPEERFCSWTIGELHALDHRVIPNGRRDEFEVGGHVDNLIAHLRPIATRVARRCRVSSQQRNRLKSFDVAAARVGEKLEILRQGAVSRKYASMIWADVGSQLGEMKRIAESEVLTTRDRDRLCEQLREIEARVNENGCEVDDVFSSSLAIDKRELYAEVIELIYECSTSHAAAKSLVDRMLHHLSGRH